MGLHGGQCTQYLDVELSYVTPCPPPNSQTNKNRSDHDIAGLRRAIVLISNKKFWDLHPQIGNNWTRDVVRQGMSERTQRGHSVQIYVRYIDNMMTLYHLRHPNRCPADDTLYTMNTGQLDNI